MPHLNERSNVRSRRPNVVASYSPPVAASTYVPLPGSHQQPAGRYPVLDGGRTTVVAVPISGSADGRYAVKQGYVSLTIEYDGIQYVASDAFSDVYGCGNSFKEAIQDYTAELYGHFAELIERESILARGLRADLARLRSVIQILR